MVPRKPAQFLLGKLRWIRILGLGLVGVSLVLAVLGTRWLPFTFVAMVLLAVAWQATKPRGPLDPEPWAKGIRGELMVAELLTELEPQGYRVLHDVETGHGNLDHVVIGPNGVFVLETKHWKGSFYPQKGHL